MTTAQKVACLFNNDGQCWTDSNGQSLDEVCTDSCFRWEGGGLWKRVRRDHETVKYVFMDGSSLVAAGGGWDLGCNDDPDCFCWLGAGCHCKDHP